jgi:hypothetical protein
MMAFLSIKWSSLVVFKQEIITAWPFEHRSIQIRQVKIWRSAPGGFESTVPNGTALPTQEKHPGVILSEILIKLTIQG